MTTTTAARPVLHTPEHAEPWRFTASAADQFTTGPPRPHDGKLIIHRADCGTLTRLDRALVPAPLVLAAWNHEADHSPRPWAERLVGFCPRCVCTRGA
jgi:hypothetical protein